MTQFGLDWNRGEQTAQLERVSSRIGKSVLAFCRAALRDAYDASFTMQDLTEWVRRETGVAPDSPGRILRDLRQRRLIDYEVTSRAQSLYRLIKVSNALGR